MKRKVSKQFLSALLALVMVIGLIPASVLTVYAGHSCPDCQEWIDGSPYCSECFACDECVEMCYQCGKCTGCTGSDICDGCTSEEGSNMCIDCAEEKGTHCPNCGTCYYIVQNWCEECGLCEDCNDICDDCSVNLGFGLLCWDCAAEKDSHCPGCGDCYFAEGLWCEECGLCVNCSEHDQECSAQFGAILCKECAAERGNHCPECEQCYFDVGSWCEECGKCEDCSPACLYCCEEEGAIICEECAIESGMHCTECSECYGGGEFCTECGVCSACADICATDEMCIDCAIANGYHCPSCEECCDQAILCEGCGEKCNECADAFCESCNLCSECVQICQGCGSCEECATICPNCEEYCSECEGICDDCELCLVCCADLAAIAGCDCAGWVCVESNDWQVHFDETHTEADGSHSARPSAVWSFDGNYHWHGCTYCDDAGHYTGKAAHSYDATGKCTTCYYVKNAKIQIVVQPKDVKYVCVTSAEEDYDERNIAHFSVKAIGNSALTYTWCRRMYVNGKLTYVPLHNPGQGECYDGPNLAILAPTDACCIEYTYACIITDEEGNETRTVDVVLTARHNYQYYKDYLTTRSNPYAAARRRYTSHVLVCVSPVCGKVSISRQHEDADQDFFCDICDSQKEFTHVGITVTAPKEGQLPNYNVTAESPAYFAMGGINNYTQYRFWFVSDNGVSNWKLIDKSTPFVAGKYYKFVVEMQTKSRYTFPTYNSEPNFWAVVNGDYVKPQKTYGMDPTHYVTISYEFGSCNDSVIENIIIDNVTEPIAGEKPTYTATVRGSGYYIDTTKNSYDDAYWLKPAEKWYYIKNGIGWFDMTDFDWVYENDTFIPGHEYQICVFLKTEDGYTFYHAKDLTMLFTASVNGTAATGNTTTSWGLTEQTIRASFPCQGKEITTVMVNGLSTPKAGEMPDYTASVAYPEWYQLDPNYAGTNGIVWYDSDDYQMEPTDTFVAGKKYKVEIKLISATLSGANTSQFTSPVSAYINGKQVVENGIWDAVYASANAVYIYYTFPKEAEYTGVMVSGSVTSFNDVNGDITLQLIPEGYSEAAYETVVRGNTVEYKFSHVAAGTYTLKVMKENHGTREYTVVVGNSSVIQDVKIHLNGDINGDGRVNNKDLGLLMQKLNSWEVEIAGDDGDVNGDGRVNNKDYGLLMQFTNGWDVTLK